MSNVFDFVKIGGGEQPIKIQELSFGGRMY